MLEYNGRYHLYECLGVGGMGRVHRAIDRLTGQTIALKQVAVPEQLAAYYAEDLADIEGKFRLALTQEFKILASLRHPYIIPVLDYGFDETGVPYFTMPLVSDPHTILEGNSSRSNQIKYRYLIQLFEALAYLHQRGILHRDLKPENILVSQDEVQLLDFGLSAAKADATQSVGSWAYVAPEVMSGEAAGEASDLYAVGVIAYQMFADRHPFDIDSPDLIDQILDETPDLALLEAPDTLRTVISTLLAKKPADRYESAREAIAALCAAIGQPLPPEEVDVRESYLQAAEFVGREEEREQMAQAVFEANQGRGSAWLIGGESGIGKSRLVDELRILCLVQGAVVVQGNAVETGARPYQIWEDVVRRLALNVELDAKTVSILQSIAPDLPTLLKIEPVPLPEVNSDVARRRLIRAVADLIGRQKQWVLLILEDLDWLTDSFELLTHLARQSPRLPLLMVGTYRTENKPQLADRLGEMTHILLERLNRSETSTLARAMLGKIGQNDKLVDLLHQETEGNVFFLVEIVRALAEEAGRLSAVTADSLPSSLYPEGIASLIGRRLAPLPGDMIELLRFAAGLGRVIDRAAIDTINRNDAVLDDIEIFFTRCSNAAVLEYFDGEWRFTHDKIRQSLMSALTESEVMRLHYRLAETIMSVYQDDPSVAAQLVYHWEQAGEIEKAGHFERIAGLYAKSLFANEDAIQHLSRALELMPADNLLGRLELLEEREEVFDLLGRRDEQLNDLINIAAIVDQFIAAGQPDRSASYFLRRARYEQKIGQFEAAIEQSQRALHNARQYDNFQVETAAFISRGRSRLRLSRFEAAIADFSTALSLASDNQLLLEAADATRFLGVTHNEMRDRVQAQRYFEKALKVYRQIGARQGESAVFNNLANVHLSRGDYMAARDYFDQALEIDNAIGDQEGVARLYSNLASLFLEVGELDQAQSYGEKSLALCMDLNAMVGVCINLLNLTEIYQIQSDVIRSEQTGREAIEVARKMGSVHLERFAMIDTGNALINLDRFDEAREILMATFSLGGEETNEMVNIEARVALADIDRREGRIAAAFELIAGEIDHVRQNPSLAVFQQPFLVISQMCSILWEAEQIDLYNQVLTLGYEELMARNGKIADERIRQNHIHNIPLHKRIYTAYRSSTAVNETAEILLP